MHPEDDELYFDNVDEDIEEDERGLSLIAKLVILVLVLALVLTLLWPLFYHRARRYPTPTATPPIFMEA
jgi:RsiW-degrading membrane proteinase PrsW (M82 family)